MLSFEFRVFQVVSRSQTDGDGLDDFFRMLTGTVWLADDTDRRGGRNGNVDGEDRVDDDMAMYTRAVYNGSTDR